MAQTRDQRNLTMGLVAEWAAAAWLGLEPGDLPESADRARHNQWRDGGVDLVTPRGTRVDVKAARPRYPELMIPLAHRPKFARSTCPVDVFLRATVEDTEVVFTCWNRRERFLLDAHVDDGTKYPVPTLWQLPAEARPLDVVIAVPSRIVRNVVEFVAEVPGNGAPWEAWLTL